MKPWNQRPFEIKNLFNPAFCGVILFRALAGYEEENEVGMPFSLALLVLPLCLHKDTRLVLAENSRGYFLKVIEKNPRILVGLATRTKQLLPFALEAFGFLMERGCFFVTEDGRLRTVDGKVRKRVTGTDESIVCQRIARFIGREFARVGDRGTIYTSLGVRP
ncbi:MAG: hypothetical protein JST79_10750 [Acidobacteria bacterium]|nr:hypothetical protein [Acidobacteriota bacterium]